MALSLLLLVLALAVAVGYAVWSYRKKAAEKALARNERYQRLFLAELQAARTGAVPVEGPASAMASAVATYSRKERLLSPSETLLFYVLKAGLPDHEIFARVSLVDIADVSQSLRDHERERELRRLAPHRLDFVVCDKSARIVAAVEFETETGGAAAESAKFKAECLKTSGIRHVRVKPTALPRDDAVRELICGG